MIPILDRAPAGAALGARSMHAWKIRAGNRIRRRLAVLLLSLGCAAAAATDESAQPSADTPMAQALEFSVSPPPASGPPGPTDLGEQAPVSHWALSGQKHRLLIPVVAIGALVIAALLIFLLLDIHGLRRTRRALAERVKEQQCLYGLFQATESTETPLAAMLEAVVALLPSGWQHPEIAAARIDWDGLIIASDNFTDQAPARMSAPIRCGDEIRGQVSLAYLAVTASADEGPFLTEERRLLDAAAARLSSVMGHRRKAFIARRREAERLAAEEHLRESEERFRTLFEQSQQPSMLLEDGCFTDVNRASLETLGITDARQLRSRTPDEISPEYQPDGQRSADKAQELLRITLETGAHRFQWQHLRSDGTPFTAEVLLTRIARQGRPLIHVVWHDITEKLRIERELAEHHARLEELVAARTAELNTAHERLRISEERYQLALEASSDGIWDWNIQENTAYCSPAYYQMLGYSPNDLGDTTERHLLQLMHPEDRQGFLETTRQALETTGVYAVEFRLRTRDGNYKWILSRGKVVARDRAGRPSRAVGTHTDLTARKRIEIELREAKEQAEAANRAKSAFLANMSHEIRTPMNAIIGMSHLALKTELTVAQQGYLNKILGASQHLLGILNDILDFSKIEAGKLILDRHEFELDALFEQVTSQIAERAATKGLELIVDVAPTIPHRLIGDSLRLGQVLVNLSGNAVKFTEQGDVAIIVRPLEQADEGLLLRFEVRDTGIGLSPEQQQRLFESFQQADSSTTRKYGGSGLGLAISKRLVELMGGRIGVTSQLGQGSTFWFTARLGIGRNSARARLPRPDPRGRRVLVVDDNAHARAILHELLASMGFKVAEAASGSAALATLQAAAETGQGFDIVYLDWRMPGLDGLETTQRIHALGLDPPPHIVMVTAYGRDDLIQQARSVAIDEVLVKPVTASVLLDTTMTILGGSEPRAMPAPLPTEPPALARIQGARILVVEDNELNQEVAMELLGSAGFQVELAENGAEAVAKARTRDYDLIFMDMQMPVMDGLEATRAIRRLPERATLPIVAMTANAMAGDRERCLEAGMNDHLAKPIDPAALWDMLTRWIEPGQRNGVATGPPAERPSPSTSNAPAGTATVPPLLLGAVPGLDQLTGQRLAMGRGSLYGSLLRRFVSDQRDFRHRLEAALASGDRVSARRLAHTLKGLAAQIGAAGLSQRAGQLEQMIGDPADSLDASALRDTLDTLDTQLTALIAAIAARLPSADTVAPLRAPGEALTGFQTIQEQLTEYLANDDFAGIELFKAQETLLRAGLGEDYERIATLIQDFDLIAAAAALRQASH
ncbi:MAG: response regulator [Sphingobacteriia bacterium]|nr:response regulator [Sphingobacteriia bacterium]NCC39310.1 response regulator [Gammaproteobacteria bacterium]